MGDRLGVCVSNPLKFYFAFRCSSTLTATFHSLRESGSRAQTVYVGKPNYL